MDISFGLALAVMLVGLVAMIINRRWAEIFYICFAMGLLAVLLKFAGRAALSLHGG